MNYKDTIKRIEDDHNIGFPSGGVVGFSGDECNINMYINDRWFYVELIRTNAGVKVKKFILKEVLLRKQKLQRINENNM